MSPTMNFIKSLAAGESVPSVFQGDDYYVLQRPARVQIAAVATSGLAADVAATTFSASIGGATLQSEGPITDKTGAATKTPQQPWDFLIDDFGPAQAPVVVNVRNGGTAAVGVQVTAILTWVG